MSWKNMLHYLIPSVDGATAEQLHTLPSSTAKKKKERVTKSQTDFYHCQSEDEMFLIITMLLLINIQWLNRIKYNTKVYLKKNVKQNINQNNLDN